MGWLEDRILQHVYTNGVEEIIIEAKAADDRPEPPKGFRFKETLPFKTNLMTKVQFEQNGRIGYRIDVGDGKQIYRSATRERYEHVAGNTSGSKIKNVDLNSSVYTKAYGEKVKEAKQKQLDQHNRNLKKILKGGK